MRRGFTVIELVLVAGLVAIFAAISFLGLVGKRGKTELDGSVTQAAAVLREAQSRSMAQSSSSGWGVYFDNSTSTTPYFSLFAGTYSSSTRKAYYKLPATIQYSTSSIASGATTSVSFAQITGASSVSTTIKFQLRADTRISSTIRIASSGAVGF